ncbi:MAG: glycosyl transferase family 2, partial [Chloroflexi bacterium]|nr:glycosyl transferase family 2 [Chloroflexota bacterium]
LLRYIARPMQFFGLLGLISLLIGGATLTGLVVYKAVSGAGIAERPLLVLSVLLVIIGVQFISMGLLGELLIRIYHEVGQRPPYAVRRTAGIAVPPGAGSDPEASMAGQGAAATAPPRTELTGRAARSGGDPGRRGG